MQDMEITNKMYAEIIIIYVVVFVFCGGGGEGRGEKYHYILVKLLNLIIPMNMDTGTFILHI